MMEQVENKSGVKNFWIYVLFDFIYGFLLPLGVVIIDYIWVSIQKNDLITPVQAVVFLLQAVLLFGIKEYLVCLTTKKTAQSTYLLGRFAFIFNCITIFLLTVILFSSANIVVVATFWVLFCIIIIKMIAYIIAKKFALKEEIKHKKVLLPVALVYLLFLFFTYNLLVPSGVNKFLFKTFGTTEFSSKELQIALIDEYNEYNNVSYFHKLTKEELEYFKDLSLEVNLTAEDISKFNKLSTIEINNVEMKEIIDFSKSRSLNYLNISNSKIDNFDSKKLGTIKWVKLNNTNINTFEISDGIVENLWIEKGNINTFKITGNSIKTVEADEISIKDLKIINTSLLENVSIKKSIVEKTLIDNVNSENIEIEKMNELELNNIQDINSFLKNSDLVFKNIKFLNDKGFRLQDNNYLKLDNMFLYVPKGTLVKELILQNMTGIVKDHYYKQISCDGTGMCTYDTSELLSKIQGNDDILSDKIELYDNTNTKIFELTIFDM